MNYIKQHWFGMSISIFMAYFLLIFIMVAISPQNDAKNRGFIPCSQEQTEKMLMCENNKAWCILKAAVSGNICYMNVINEGIVAFVSGKQSRPWSNYLFEPEPAGHSENSAEYEQEIQAVLEEDKSLIDGFEAVKEKNKELLEKININQEDIQNDEK